jgi:hypothetical protein
MRRWLLMLMVFLLIPGAALAGGGGSIRLARSIYKVAVGKHPVYLQLLQHDHYPRTDAKVTITAHSPNGTDIITNAELDPTYGDLWVFKGNLPVDRPGVWQVTITTTESEIIFPPYQFQVEVMPAGTKLPDPGPVAPFRDASSLQGSAPVAAAPARPAGWVWPAGAASAGVLALVGYVAWRRQGARAG